MKKKLTALLLLLCLLSFALSACNSEASAEQAKANFFEELNQDAAVTQQRFDSSLAFLNSAERYTYTVSLYLEDILNFDDANRLMPKEQIPSDEKCWYKPALTYTFTKVGADTYYKAEFTDKTYERNEKKTFLYFINKKTKISYMENAVQTVVYEGWSVAGVTTLKTDGEIATSHAELVALLNRLGYTYAMTDAEFDGDIAKFTIEKLCDYDSIKNALFADKSKSFLGKKVGVYQSYYVMPVAMSAVDGIAYQDCDSSLCSGYGEDMKFTWDRIQTVKITTSCVTQKRDKVLMFEHYNEVIGSYKVTETRIYDNQTVTTWKGDRISATKAVFEFNYGKKKAPVEIPAI